MYQIENIVTEIRKNDTEMMKYSDFCKICIENVWQWGIRLDEQRKRIRVLDALEKKEIILEDADFDILKICVETMTWAVIHKDIVKFSDYILTLKPKE